MKSATEAGRLNAEAAGLYDKFMEYSRDLKVTTNKQVRRMFEEDLSALHAEARSILQSPTLKALLHGPNQIKLELITKRSAEQWILWAKQTAKKE